MRKVHTIMASYTQGAWEAVREQRPLRQRSSRDSEILSQIVSPIEVNRGSIGRNGRNNLAKRSLPQQRLLPQQNQSVLGQLPGALSFHY